MNKKNDKRICWNCDGDVSLTLVQCPYCGVNVSEDTTKEKDPVFQQFSSPYQSSDSIPKPPYAGLFSRDFTVSEEEWDKALEEEKEEQTTGKEVENASPTTKKEIVAFLLLLPGIVFCLFSLILFFFSEDGVLTLKWNQNLAYFYLIGAIPLLFLGWRSFK